MSKQAKRDLWKLLFFQIFFGAFGKGLEANVLLGMIYGACLFIAIKLVGARERHYD